MKLQFDDAVDVVMGMCKNISIGGMQITAESPRPQGSLVRFEVEIEEGVTIRGLGEVVWMRTENVAAGEPGMGIKFRFIEQRDRQLIYKLVSEHIKERLAQKHPGTQESPTASPPAATPATPAPSEAPVPDGPPPAESLPVPTSSPAPQERPQASAAPNSLPQTGQEPIDLDQSFLTLDAAPEATPTGPLGPALELAMEPQEPVVEEVGFDSGFDAGPAVETPDRATAPKPWEDEEIAPSDLESGSATAYDDDLYHPRVARRRSFPVVPIVLLLLLAGVVLVYLSWERIVGPPAPTGGPAEAPPPDTAPPPSAEPPADELAADLQGTAQTSPLDADATEPPAGLPPAPPPPLAVAETRELTRVVDISWTRLPGGVKIEITGDGRIPEGRYSRHPIGGENPRELVKLKGVVQQYSPGLIRLSGAPVSQVRVGYHPDRRELHVVLDLLDRSTRISKFRSQGNKLEIYLE